MISNTSVLISTTLDSDPRRGEQCRLQRQFTVRVKRNGTSLEDLGKALEEAVRRVVEKHNRAFDDEHGAARDL